MREKPFAGHHIAETDVDLQVNAGIGECPNELDTNTGV